MEIRQLRYFVKSAELLNFTAAAVACFVTQGTLSQQLKQLEQELDVLLFDRIGKRVLLTEAGRLFLPYAKHTVEQSENGRQILDDFKEIRIGTIRIGTTYALAHKLPPSILEFSKQYPLIKISMVFGTSADLLQQLKDAELDFVLAFGGDNSMEDIDVINLFESKLALVTSLNHPLAVSKKVGLATLGPLALALPAKGFDTRSFLDRIFMQEEFLPNIAIELNDIPILLELVKSGNWCTILTTASVMDRKDVSVIPISGLVTNRQASIFWSSRIYPKKAAKKMVEIIRLHYLPGV